MSCMVQVNQCQVELAGTVYSAPPTHYYNNPYGQMVFFVNGTKIWLRHTTPHTNVLS